MARAPRVVVAGELHYVLQRGHNQQAVFVDDVDREAYLGMLRDAARHHGVAIHAYALLDAEVQLLATPRSSESLSRLMQSLGRRYVAAFNRRHGRSGTLWEGRFRTCVADGASLGAQALVHVETLAARTGLVASASEWPWSSVAHHLGRRRDPMVTEHSAYWALGNTPFERESAHANLVHEGLSAALTERFDRAVLQGRALGPARFSARIEELTGVPQHARPRGRPAHSSNGEIKKTVPN
jgi:putative transposase